MNHSHLTFISQLATRSQSSRSNALIRVNFPRNHAKLRALFYRLDRGKQPREIFPQTPSLSSTILSFRVASVIQSPVESIGKENVKMLIGGFRGRNLAIVKMH